jgi:AcrR family transcriptional regulator
MASSPQRKSRSDGERTRAVILDQAARLATVEGLSGLSLSRLAEAVGISKSGLFAHFGSKEELQLATIESADAVFERAVLARVRGTTGMVRVRGLVDAYLDYVYAETFPGGCFFAAALVELSMQPGDVRDALLAFMQRWLGELEAAVREAQEEGAIAADEDPRQLAFELEAAFFLANAQFTVQRNKEPIERARRMISKRLA